MEDFGKWLCKQLGEFLYYSSISYMVILLTYTVKITHYDTFPMCIIILSTSQYIYIYNLHGFDSYTYILYKLYIYICYRLIYGYNINTLLYNIFAKITKIT